MKRVPSFFYTIITAAAAAQINYAIIHNTFVYIVILVMLAHELGHYFAAKIHGAKPQVPFFIPFPFFVLAITRIPNLHSHATKTVSYMGPLVGFLSVLLLLCFNYIFNFTSFLLLLFLAFNEIVLNYFGADGAKYRKAKRESQPCYSF